MELTMGQLLINEAIPEDMRDYNRIWDKRATEKFFDDLARRHPDKYRETLHRLHQVGGLSAYVSGHSVGLKDLQSVSMPKDGVRKLRKRVDTLLAAEGSLADKNKHILELLGSLGKQAEQETFDKLLKDNNPLALEVASGARGNATQLNSVVGSPVLMLDQNDNPTPLPVTSSYSEGLSPAEYWMQMYGTRKGAVATKMSVADAGFASKQLALAAHKLIATDSPLRPGVGLPVRADDPDNVGTVLAQAVGPYKAGEVITPSMINNWPRGVKEILIRSPISDIAEDGGVPLEALGIRERGGFADPGEQVGIPAIQTITEQLSQLTLNVKHCLIRGTMVKMADGTDKRIEDIKVGDWVFGSDTQGRLTPVRVTRVFNNGLRECRLYYFNNSSPEEERVLGATEDHNILGLSYISGGRDELDYTPRKLPLGFEADSFCALLPTEVTTEDEPALQAWVAGLPDRLQRTHSEPLGLVETHDIEVDHPDHFFALSNGLIVSNSGGAGGVRQGGFGVINQLIQVPTTYTNGAAHAVNDGRVKAIEKAAQGGWYAIVGDEKHYVPPDQEVTVRVGDRVEAGDVLSNGLPNPAMIAKYKGVGEGRRYFMDLMRDVLKLSKINTNRRNVELLSRSLINHVEVQDESDSIPGALPGDVMEYDRLAAVYQPRDGTVDTPLESVRGGYLEQPVMHYSIGTRLTPSVTRRLREHRVDRVMVHNDPPPFTPRMERAMTNLLPSPDWMERLGSFYVGRGLLDAVHRGGTADMDSNSYIPKLVTGQSLQGFGT
ncbi:MAG: hypothetical protein WC992_00280 [Acholeplasmataceae bacterium]